MIDNNIFELIKLSLWGEGHPVVDTAVYQEMKDQAIAVLPASVLSSLNLSPELARKWRNTVFQHVAYNANYIFVQSSLPINVPYAILKGTSAAQYYPHPEYRTMGDIDIITRQEDFNLSCEMLKENAWSETTNNSDMKRGRHRTFAKKGITVEVHAFFASMTDVQKAKAFDDFIISNIAENHVLPDLINGLVLIEHVNQHMEQGIGLRQIIDWMMFVDKCLTDDRWEEFETMVTEIGLKKLAVVVTRMCEIHLGLSPHRWCAEANEKACRDLMEYVMKCGNFGVKLNQTDTVYVGRLYQLCHPIMTIKELQQKGCESFKIARNPILKPFAWIIEGARRLNKSRYIFGDYKNARKINTLFKSLGVKRNANGLVFFENGRYYKQR